MQGQRTKLNCTAKKVKIIHSVRSLLIILHKPTSGLGLILWQTLSTWRGRHLLRYWQHPVCNAICSGCLSHLMYRNPAVLTSSALYCRPGTVPSAKEHYLISLGQAPKDLLHVGRRSDPRNPTRTRNCSHPRCNPRKCTDPNTSHKSGL